MAIAKPKPKPPKCLVPDCQRESLHRGLCSGHYQYARALVSETKKTTWKELEDKKKCLPAKVAGKTGKTTWFLT